MKIEELYSLYSQHYLVDTDTRNIRQNTIYFALKGANFNGNLFAQEALDKGAIYSIVDEEEYATSSKIILVDDVLKTLQNLASFHRQELNIPIIGLTGSNGKTTTKELINIVLSSQYKTTATVGNLNNHIGVPLTLLSMTPNTEIGIVEMGANHHKEIEFLSKIAKPDYGYITNFGKAHLEGFGSIEGVIEAKSELYQQLKKTNKTVFVNPDDSVQIEKTKNMNFILFESSIKLIEANPFVKITYLDELIATNLIGAYNYSNLCAAITIGKHFNINISNIKEAIENYTPTNNRSQVIKTTKDNMLILDAYNANPTSMKAALLSFSQKNASDKTVVLGDMFELGTDSLKEHQYIANYCSELGFGTIILVGKIFSKIQTTNIQLTSFEELKRYFKERNINNTQVLIKGSRGMALERIVDFL